MIIVPFLVVFLLTGWGGDANRYISLAFFALHIEEPRVAHPLIVVVCFVLDARSFLCVFDFVSSARTADLFHKKNCHLQQAVHFLKYSYLSAFLKEV